MFKFILKTVVATVVVMITVVAVLGAVGTIIDTQTHRSEHITITPNTTNT